MTILSSYMEALASNDTQECIAIEQDHGLYGYPPEIVSVGLKAIDMGLDPDAAIDDFISE